MFRTLGRSHALFLGLTPGWVAGKDVAFTTDDVAAKIDRIRETDGFVVPGSVMEETMAVMQQLAG